MVLVRAAEGWATATGIGRNRRPSLQECLHSRVDYGSPAEIAEPAAVGWNPDDVRKPVPGIRL